MYTKKRSQQFSDKYLLLLLGKFVGLILIFNASTCQCKPGGPDNTASINMEVKDSNPLIGLDEEHKHRITTIFQLDNSGNEAELEHFKLKVSIVEQKAFKGATTGSKIVYTKDTSSEDASNVETFTDTQTFEKPLTEFTSAIKLVPDQAPKDITVSLDLIPADNAIEVKLKFELINTAGVSPTPVEVRWIRSEIAINIPDDSSGPTSFFSLIPLKSDIEDLKKYTVVVKSIKENEATFHFEPSTETDGKATLEELLKLGRRNSRLAMNQETNAIQIRIQGTSAKFTVSVFADDSTDGAADTKLISQAIGEWHQVDPAKGLGAEEEGLNDIKNNQYKDEKKLRDLKEQKQELIRQKKEVPKEVQKELTTKLAGAEANKNKKLKELKDKKGTMENEAYKTERENIVNTFNTDVESLKEGSKKEKEEKLKNIQDELNKNSEAQRELKPKVKEEKEKAKATTNKIKKEDKQSTQPTPAKLILIVPKSYADSDKGIFITIKNLGTALEQKDLQNITLWYEIKNSVGDTSKVNLQARKVLHGEKKSKKDKNNYENIQRIAPGQKVGLADFFKNFAHTSKDIKLRIATADKSDLKNTESMQFVFHLEGMEKHVPPATVTWSRDKLLQK
jgi:hypothetical protein